MSKHVAVHSEAGINYTLSVYAIQLGSLSVAW